MIAFCESVLLKRWWWWWWFFSLLYNLWIVRNYWLWLSTF